MTSPYTRRVPLTARIATPPPTTLQSSPASAIHRPPTADFAVLAIALVSASAAGPLIAATAAPALAIAFWRNVIGTGVLAPHAFLRHRGELRSLRRTEWLAALAAGLALGAHFAAWTSSLTMTSVASAAAFGSAQPIFAALIARARGQHVPRRAWLGILIATVGVVTLSSADLRLSGLAFAGDLAALLASVLAAVYMTFGAKVRQTVSLTPYAVICYSTAAMTLGIGAVCAGQSLTGLSGDAWVKILILTATAQLLGHTLFNHVLRTTSVTVVSVSMLLQVPLAALIAAVWLGQLPSLTAIPGVLLTLAGLLVAVTGNSKG